MRKIDVIQVKINLQKLSDPKQIIHIEKHYTIEVTIFKLKNPNASGSKHQFANIVYAATFKEF